MWHKGIRREDRQSRNAKRGRRTKLCPGQRQWKRELLCLLVCDLHGEGLACGNLCRAGFGVESGAAAGGGERFAVGAEFRLLKEIAGSVER